MLFFKIFTLVKIKKLNKIIYVAKRRKFMFISKKKLITFSSIVSSIIVIALFGTPCYQYTGLITRGDYYLGFDFGFGGNVIIEAFNATLFGIIGVILLFNVIALFIEKLEEKKLVAINSTLWVLAIGFSICCLCCKFVNVSYNFTNSVIYILLVTIIALVLNFVILLKNDEK